MAKSRKKNRKFLDGQRKCGPQTFIYPYSQPKNEIQWPGKDPLVIRFLGERITYVGRTETERKPYQYRLTLRYVERTQQNPFGLVVSAVEQNEGTRNS